MKKLLYIMLAALQFSGAYAIEFLMPEALQSIVKEATIAAKESSQPCEYIETLCAQIEKKEQPAFLDIYLGLSQVAEKLEQNRISLDSSNALQEVRDYLQVMNSSRAACINSCAQFTKPPCPPPCPKCNGCVVSKCFRYGSFCVSAAGDIGQNSDEFFVTLEGSVASVKFIEPFCRVMAVVVNGDSFVPLLTVTNGAASTNTFYFTLPNPLAQSCYSFLAVEIL